MNVTLVSLVLEVTLAAPLRSPAAPFSIRSFFPAAFKRAVARLHEPAWWEATFGQQLSPDPEAVRRYQKPPLPFVFDLPALPVGHQGAAELGLTGVAFPDDLGGAGFDHVAYTIVIEEVSRACASTGTRPPKTPTILSKFWPSLGRRTRQKRIISVYNSSAGK